MTNSLIFILATLIGFPNPTIKKNVSFSVIQKKEKIGEIQGMKFTSDEKVIYSCITEATPRKIIKVKFTSEYEVQMESGKMKTANANVTVRGNTYAENHIEYCKENCAEKGNEDTQYIQKDISYAITMLYFEEPVGIHQVYSVLDGTFHSLVHKGNHVYEKRTPDGKKSLYHYQNGNLIKAVLDIGLIELTVVRN